MRRRLRQPASANPDGDEGQTMDPDAWCVTDAAGIVHCTAPNPDTRCDTTACGVIDVERV